MTAKYTFNIISVCRLCLLEDGTMPIFNKDKTTKSLLLQRIPICFSLEICEDDGLPGSICKNCACLVDKFYDFRELCLQSDATLRECLKNLKLYGSKVDFKYPELDRDISVHEDETCIAGDNEIKTVCEGPVANLTSVTQGSDTDISNEYSEGIAQTTETNKIITESVIVNKNTELFHCKTCFKSFAKLMYLKKHEVVHTRRKPQTCSNCGNDFAHSEDLSRAKRCYCRCTDIQADCSIEDLNESSKFVCSLCSKTFTKRVYLKRHEVVHSGERPYVCTECGNSFSRTGDLAKHLRIHARSMQLSKTSQDVADDKELQPLSCKVCSRTFTKQNYLKQHEVVHSDTSTYLCDQCGKSFYRRGALMQHKATHSTVKSHFCNICNKAFAFLGRLKEHKRLHTGTKSYLCNMCGKAFSTKEGLLGHERTHTGEKPYLCTLCDRSFATSSNFRTHMRHHTEGKRFPCNACGMSFFTKSGLERHERLHIGIKPFECDICTVAFYTKREVIRHKLFHLGNKRFSCDKCNKSYYERQHLVIHQRTHTGENILMQLVHKILF